MGVLTLPGRPARRRRRACGRCRRTGCRPTRDLDEVADIYDSFRDPHARAAIRHVVRAVVDWRGQIVTMADRAYLTEAMPMCVVWGRDDQVIPVRHASNAAALAPDARVEVIPNAGHFPHKDHPQRFARIVHDFIRTTQPASYHRARFRGPARGEPAPPRSARRGAVADDRPAGPRCVGDPAAVTASGRCAVGLRRRRPPA